MYRFICTYSLERCSNWRGQPEEMVSKKRSYISVDLFSTKSIYSNVNILHINNGPPQPSAQRIMRKVCRAGEKNGRSSVQDSVSVTFTARWAWAAASQDANNSKQWLDATTEARRKIRRNETRREIIFAWSPSTIWGWSRAPRLHYYWAVATAMTLNLKSNHFRQRVICLPNDLLRMQCTRCSTIDAIPCTARSTKSAQFFFSVAHYNHLHCCDALNRASCRH